MTQEEKQLLIKDLCARLPYGVKINVPHHYEDEDAITTLDAFWLHDIQNGRKEIKPYLHPMSSMTEEELKEFYMVEGMDTNPVILNKPQYDWHFTTNGIDYLLSRHFDFRGLIPMGLALEATEGMYKTEQI